MILKRLRDFVRRRRVAPATPKAGTIAYLEQVTAENQARLDRVDALIEGRRHA